MNMLFWKPKHSVCAECGVHFDLPSTNEALWGHLCQTHRKLAIELDLKRLDVVNWAWRNWERLADMMDEELAASQATTPYYNPFRNYFCNQTLSDIERLRIDNATQNRQYPFSIWRNKSGEVTLRANLNELK
jgi:hypothetical protein